MEERENFLFLKDWYDRLKGIEDIEERNDFVWRIVQYGIGMKFEPTGNGFVDGWLREICNAIDKMKSSYRSKVEGGKIGGRQQLFDREELKRLIREGKTGKEIAAYFSVDPSAIYHDPVWMERKKYNLYKEN